MDFVDVLITWLVTGASLLLITKLPLGIEIDNPGVGYISAAVLGLVNALLNFFFFSLPNTLTFGIYGFFAKLLTLGLFSFILNVAALLIAARLINGFRLSRGVASAVTGAIALAVVSNLITALFVGQAPVA